MPMRRWRVILTAIALAGSGRAAASEPTAESLYVAGRFAEAERAYATRLVAARHDTLAALRVASMRLLRDDRTGARAILEPLLAQHADSRMARSLLAEACVRDLDFPRAANLERALGRESQANQLESFGEKRPYRDDGPARTTVPFVQTDPLPLIEVRLNGRGPYLFLIDTGGSTLIVDPVLADSLGCPRFGEESGTFGGGRRRAVTLSKVESLGLGAGTFHDVPAGLLDCSRFSAAAMGRRVWGVLGTVVLMRTGATLDYPGGALILEPRGTTNGSPQAGPPGAEGTPEPGRHVVPFWIAGDHYMLAIGRLNDGPEALWFVDTGLAGAAVTAPAATLEEASIPVPDTSGTGPSGVGGGGAMKVQMFPVTSFHLGDVTGGPLLGIFGPFPGSLERAFGCRIAGIISHAFFRPYRVTFDFDAMRLILEKPAR